MPLHDSIIEITTNVLKGGCPIHCDKYCPQELIVAHYKGPEYLSLEDHNRYVDCMPSYQCLSYCGFSEPFINQKCIDMIEYSDQTGHPVEICSTLVGMNEDQARRLIKIPIAHFLLHHPDYYHNAKIPLTPRYWRVKEIIETGIEYLRDIRMSGCFTTVHVEDMARHPEKMYRFKSRRTCNFMDKLNYVMMPNGDLYYCCMTRSLSDKVGNMNETPYTELAAKHHDMGVRLGKDPNSICHICPSSKNYYNEKGRELKDKLLAGKSIKRTILGDAFE